MSTEGNDQIDSTKMTMGIAIGPPIGFVLGVAMDNIGMGLTIGMVLGLALGIAWSQT
ncbi:membrane protein [Halostagnicola larsenii XH-48]|uniref:Membrane protein n=1 Tax=Halostagnicola larsenii XH-48 TaxID=797299 RepID=W0JHX9_9EURY|nr:membrane protein [Halostagnicola larsenii XH-48]